MSSVNREHPRSRPAHEAEDFAPLTGGRGPALLAASLLLVLVGVLFGRSVTFDFIKYDEMQHVVENPDIRSLSPQAVWHTFTDFSKRSYYPIRQLSFAIDYAVWGLHPGGYHLTNVLLHGASVCLLLFLLLRGFAEQATDRSIDRTATRPVAAAALGASLFAFHPVVSEPVTWASGREELLMVFFGLLSLHANQSARHAWERGRRGEPVRAWRYWLWQGAAWLAFVMAALSNAVGAIIPAIVLMHDLVIGRVRSIRRLVFAHGPMWLLAAGVVILKLSHQDVRSPTERLPLLVDMSASERLYTALSLYAYNWRTVVWPRGLILAYPNLLVGSLFAACTLAGIVLLMATLVALWCLRRQPIALAGLLWFLLALAPSGQLLPHHIFRADRFLYLPMAGLAWVAAAGVARACARPYWTAPVRLGSALAMIALAVLTFRQVGYWRDTVTLFTHCLRYSEREPQSYNIRALAYTEAGRNDLALADLNQAVNLAPADGGYRVNRARVLSAMGRSQEAIADYSEAIALQSTDADAFSQRAMAYLKEGRYDEAVQDFGHAVALQLKDASAYFNRANAWMGLDRIADAIADYSKALELQPEHVEALNNRGAAYVKQGQDDAALADFEAALRLDPSYVRAHINLGSLHARRERYADAIASFGSALQLESDNREALINRARACERLGEHDRAAADFARYCRLVPDDAVAHREWGNACAACRRFEEAIACYSRSIELEPDEAECYNRRGILRAERQDAQGAIVDFDKAIELRPTDPSGFANRGLAYVRIGEADKARADWEHVIALDPAGPLAPKARRSLEWLAGQAPDGHAAPASRPGEG